MNETYGTSTQSLIIKRCSCGKPLTRENVKFLGRMEGVKGYDLDLFVCPDCNSTNAVRVYHDRNQEPVK